MVKMILKICEIKVFTLFNTLKCEMDDYEKNNFLLK